MNGAGALFLKPSPAPEFLNKDGEPLDREVLRKMYGYQGGRDLLVMKGLAALFLFLSPAWAGDLGIADMQQRAISTDGLEIFRGLCGGPLSDTKEKCLIAFVNGRLVTSTETKNVDEIDSAFEGVRGITPSQVKSISWHEPPNANAPQEFVNEIIYESSEGKWTRAGFSFSHGDQVRGFYSSLMRWMSGDNVNPDSRHPAIQMQPKDQVL